MFPRLARRDDGGMTITEFLLARIAEDEALAREWAPRHPANKTRARIEAECEAKRRIVEEMGRLAGDERPTSNLDEDGWILLCWETLETLAAVYADHPDYDESWRA
jgi:hypothetical protein